MTNHNFVLCSTAFIEAINSLVGAVDNSLLWNKLGLIERSFIPVPVDHFRPLGKASSILNKLMKRTRKISQANWKANGSMILFINQTEEKYLHIAYLVILNDQRKCAPQDFWKVEVLTMATIVHNISALLSRSTRKIVRWRERWHSILFPAKVLQRIVIISKVRPGRPFVCPLLLIALKTYYDDTKNASSNWLLCKGGVVQFRVVLNKIYLKMIFKSKTPYTLKWQDNNQKTVLGLLS